MFKEKFDDLCADRGVSPNTVCKSIGLSNSMYSKWTDDSVPRNATLKKIADYFGVPVSYFDDPPVSEVDVAAALQQQGKVKAKDYLDDYEKELILALRSLPPLERMTIMTDIIKQIRGSL